jgi:hypothetical protein
MKIGGTIELTAQVTIDTAEARALLAVCNQADEFSKWYFDKFGAIPAEIVGLESAKLLKDTLGEFAEELTRFLAVDEKAQELLTPRRGR